MDPETDIEYWQRRAAEAHAMADAAGNRAARSIHLVLARSYIEAAMTLTAQNDDDSADAE